MQSPSTAWRPWPSVSGPVGLAETNSTCTRRPLPGRAAPVASRRRHRISRARAASAPRRARRFTKPGPAISARATRPPASPRRADELLGDLRAAAGRAASRAPAPRCRRSRRARAWRGGSSANSGGASRVTRRREQVAKRSARAPCAARSFIAAGASPWRWSRQGSRAAPDVRARLGARTTTSPGRAQPSVLADRALVREGLAARSAPTSSRSARFSLLERVRCARSACATSSRSSQPGREAALGHQPRVRRSTATTSASATRNGHGWTAPLPPEAACTLAAHAAPRCPIVARHPGARGCGRLARRCTLADAIDVRPGASQSRGPM